MQDNIQQLREEFKGKVSRLNDYLWGAGLLMLNTSVIRLRSISEKILLRDFLFDLIDLPVFKNQIMRLITGSAQPNFGPYHLNKVKIPLPPLETQKQIIAKLSAVQDYKKQLLAQKSKLKELFDSVISKSMNN